MGVPFALNTRVYVRVYWYVDTTYPTSNVSSVGLDAGSISNRLGIVRAEPDGSGTVSLRFGGSFGTTQVGSNSAPLPLNTWVKIEVAMLLGTGAVDTLEGRIDGVTFASGTGLNISDILTGIRAYIQTGDQIISDDFVCNDANGANQNSWPPDSKIVLLRPISLNANGGSWTDDAAATTSAALTNALDNAPPNGIADTVAGGGNHQVRNAGANSSLDMNLATYASAGIAAGDTINAVLPVVNVGAPLVTGAKTGSFGVSSNPVITNRAFTGGTTAPANFWRGVAPATYSTGWTLGWERGTVTYSPTVTLGSSPVARLTITGGTASRIAMCDAMGLYVDYTPAPPASAPSVSSLVVV